MKVAVLSFAHLHAGGYLTALRDRDDVELLTTDPDHDHRPAEESGGPEFAEQFGVSYVADYAAIWDWQPDAVVICAENAWHRPLAEQAASAGAHVLCEKPLATTVADAEAMVTACERAGVSLMIAHPVRYSTAFGELRDAYRNGSFGALIGVTGTNNGRLPRGRQWFVDPELAGGGSLTDHTVHVADLLDDLLDQTPPVSVYARTNAILHGDEVATETGGLISVEYASGVIASIDCSWSKPDSYPTWGGLTLNLVGETGIADMDAFNSRVEGHSETNANSIWIPYGDNADLTMIDEFLAAAANDRRPQPDGQSGLRTVKIVQAGYESARTGQVVPVG